MDPRGLHVFQRSDRTAELAFERAPLIDVGEKGGGSESPRLIEDLVTDRTAAGQPFFGHGHAQAGDLIGGHHDALTTAMEFMGHAHGFQPADDFGTIGEIETAIEQCVVGLDDAKGEIGEKSEQPDGGDAEADDLAGREPAEHVEHRRRSPVRPLIGGLIKGRRQICGRIAHGHSGSRTAVIKGSSLQTTRSVLTSP